MMSRDVHCWRRRRPVAFSRWQALPARKPARPFRNRMRPGHGGTDPGPRNLLRDRQNPDMLVPPSTDHGTLPNLRFSFSDSHVRQEGGGWTRQVTVRELGVSKDIAGVNMRLNAGGVRELHWHKAAEWAYMLYGTARITAIDPQGHNFVDDVGVGDLWYFAGGIPHSIQGLNPDGCEFLLVFDDGDFDEDNTFLLSDWFKHTPNEVLSKNFGVPGLVLRARPGSERALHFRGPGAGRARLRQDRRSHPGVADASATGCWRSSRSRPRAARCGSPIPACFRRRRRSPRRWSRSSPAACASCTGIPTPTNGSITSKARRGWACSRRQVRRALSILWPATSATCRSRWGTTSKTPARRRCVSSRYSRADYYADVSLNQWLALTPPELVQAHLKLDPQTLAALHKEKFPVVPA